MCRPRRIRPAHRRDASGTSRPPAPPAPPRPRLSKDRGGTTALEFALVGPVFIALVFFVIEVGWQLTVNLALHVGVAAGGRYAATGAVLTGVTRDDAVRIKIIAASGGILKSEHLKPGGVTAYPDPAGLVSRSGGTASAGASGEFVEYRVTYTQSFITPAAPLFRLLTGRDITPSITHTANLVAQNEPF